MNEAASPDGSPNGNPNGASNNGSKDPHNVLGWLRNVLRGKPDATLRSAIEGYIEDLNSGAVGASISSHENILISNVLQLRDMTAADIMVPRVDIVAVEINTSREEFLSLLAEKQFSRIPVYRETLDDVLGVVLMKDVLAYLAAGRDFALSELVRDVQVVSPAMPLPDLLLQMRQSRRHMCLVVDEYGGIDGLVTLGDVIESIVGELDDEHDQDSSPQIVEEKDETLIADARVDIEEFETRYGSFLSEEEREDADTLGGLVYSIAGRIPARGEVLRHDSGLVFEILDANPRLISRLRIKNFPTRAKLEE